MRAPSWSDMISHGGKRFLVVTGVRSQVPRRESSFQALLFGQSVSICCRLSSWTRGRWRERAQTGYRSDSLCLRQSRFNTAVPFSIGSRRRNPTRRFHRWRHSRSLVNFRGTTQGTTSHHFSGSLRSEASLLGLPSNDRLGPLLSNFTEFPFVPVRPVRLRVRWRTAELVLFFRPSQHVLVRSWFDQVHCARCQQKFQSPHCKKKGKRNRSRATGNLCLLTPPVVQRKNYCITLFVFVTV